MPAKKRGLLARLRRTFLTGLVILLPLFATYLMISFLFRLFTGVGAPIVKGILHLTGLDEYEGIGYFVPFVNLLLSLAVVFALGFVGTHFLGKRLLRWVEDVLMRVPLVKNVYGGVKQVIDTLKDSKSNFQRVVLVQYPQKGQWVLGFVAAERPDALKLHASGKSLSIFIPTTPNPTSGFLILASSDEVVDTDYTIEDAFKFIISGGVVGRDFQKSP
jgi:uncharacterized membrane protein